MIRSFAEILKETIEDPPEEKHYTDKERAIINATTPKADQGPKKGFRLKKRPIPSTAPVSIDKPVSIDEPAIEEPSEEPTETPKPLKKVFTDAELEVPDDITAPDYDWTKIATIEDKEVVERKKYSNWMDDPKALKDFKNRKDAAEEFFKNTWRNNGEVVTSDGYTINFTKRGRQEFFASVESAFFSPKFTKNFIAAGQTLNNHADLANELLATVNCLGGLVKKSKIHGPMATNLKKDAKPDVKGYDTFMTPVTINGKQRQMKIKVEFFTGVNKEEEPYEGRRYYYHWLTDEPVVEPVIKPIEELKESRQIYPVIVGFEFV